VNTNNEKKLQKKRGQKRTEIEREKDRAIVAQGAYNDLTYEEIEAAIRDAYEGGRYANGQPTVGVDQIRDDYKLVIQRHKATQLYARDELVARQIARLNRLIWECRKHIEEIEASLAKSKEQSETQTQFFDRDKRLTSASLTKAKRYGDYALYAERGRYMDRIANHEKEKAALLGLYPRESMFGAPEPDGSGGMRMVWVFNTGGKTLTEALTFPRERLVKAREIQAKKEAKKLKQKHDGDGSDGADGDGA
jgi:hypothetical protein